MGVGQKEPNEIDEMIKYFVNSGKELNDRLNIFVYGNINNLNKLKYEIFKEDIRQNNDVHYTKYNHDWFFNFYDKEKEDIFKKIVQDINKDTLRNQNNNIIIILFNSISKDKNTISNTFKNFKTISNYEQIILLFSFESENLKENKENELNEIKSIIKEYEMDKQFLNNIKITYYTENNYNQIINQLSPISSYCNNIGDIFNYLDLVLYKNFQPEKFKNYTINYYKAVFNILVLGRAGCGKSTLINLILNENKAKVGIGESVTKIVSKYVHKKYPIVITDTPGIDIENGVNYFHNYLKLYQSLFPKGKNKIHLVLYLFNASNERVFSDEEIEIIKYLTEKKMPIFFVITRTETKEKSKKYRESVKLKLMQKNLGEYTNNIYCCNLLNDGKYKRFGIDELFNAILNSFNEEKKKLKNALSNINDKNEIAKLLRSSFFFEANENNTIIDFKDYLNDISNYIINKYYLYSEKKLSKDDYINGMMINNLAFEFGKEVNGSDYIDKYRKSVDDEVKKKKTKGENAIYIKELGEKCKKYFLSDLGNDQDINTYLADVIKDYITALDSFSKINKDIDNNEIYNGQNEIITK